VESTRLFAIAVSFGSVGSSISLPCRIVPRQHPAGTTEEIGTAAGPHPSVGGDRGRGGPDCGSGAGAGWAGLTKRPLGRPFVALSKEPVEAGSVPGPGCTHLGRSDSPGRACQREQQVLNFLVTCRRRLLGCERGRTILAGSVFGDRARASRRLGPTGMERAVYIAMSHIDSLPRKSLLDAHSSPYLAQLGNKARFTTVERESVLRRWVDLLNIRLGNVSCLSSTHRVAAKSVPEIRRNQLRARRLRIQVISWYP